jgi:putative flippase GtrA
MTNILERYPIIRQFLRFAVIGVINTGVDLLVLNLLMIVFDQRDGIHFTIFKTVSFAIAVISSYFLNKYWAFEDKNKKEEVRKFSQFIAVSIIGALINVGIASLVVSIRPDAFITSVSVDTFNQIWGNFAALCGTAIGLIWNFLGYKFVVFKK